MRNQKHWIIRDLKARQTYLPVELNKLVLRSLLANNSFSWALKFYWSKLFNKYGSKRSIAFFRHGCLWTSSGRSVFRFFKLSRHWCKDFAAKSYIVGMRKSSY